ncbi:hypothetical protein SAMN05421741_1216 [Paenimyroides ummariense]|uniref:Uncharacterized protein n=1 Tax=Paenimyroides ummariense TaxID=913024 RepID=A0A1I5EJW9_9FLAO|nr:hypothetical protein [Paenimyroides ummariense]SFO11804.1 hypothetical protein SAMN05421741_1216 [Paenimyroides ummariense]
MKNYKLTEVIDLVITANTPNFTGLGLIIYKKSDCLPIESINDDCLLENSLVGIEDIGKKLIEVSKKDNICHDGFHLLNERFELTALCHYFSTPISQIVKPLRKKGSRYRTAFYGSLLDNVLCTVSISSYFEVFIFINGKEYTLDEYKML